MDNDLSILVALDTLPKPVDAATVAHFTRKYWKGELPEDTAAAEHEVLGYLNKALPRLVQTGDVQMTPSKFHGSLWSLTDAGRANARQ